MLDVQRYYTICPFTSGRSQQLPPDISWRSFRETTRWVSIPSSRSRTLRLGANSRIIRWGEGGTRTKVEDVDIKEAQSRFEGLVGRVAEGTRFILRENEKAVAQLAPLTARVAGLHAGSIWTSDDFDAPLPDEFWASGT